MSGRLTLALCATAAMSVLIDSPPVLAQSDRPSAAAGSGLEEIVVTARRREERLQTVPMAITAFTAGDLEKKSIQNLVDLQHAVPSFTYSPTQRSGIGSDPTIRGLPGVVTYFAEVPLIQGNQVGDYQSFDNTVQVLKGPQGTLFGQNTTGGAVLLDPTKPTNNFEGYVGAMLGSDNWQQFEGVLNIPIVEDKLLVRVGGKHDQRDGFTTVYQGKFKGLDMDNRDSWYGRVSVTFRPTDNLENYIVADETYVHTNGSSLILDALNYDPNFKGSTVNYLLNKPPYASQTPTYWLNLQKSLGVRQIVGFYPVVNVGGPNNLTYDFPGPIEKAQNYTIVDITKYDLTDDISIKNIAGYVNSRELTRSDFTDTPIVSQGFYSPRGWNNASVGAGGGVGMVTQYSDELQIKGKALNDALQYTVGGFLLYRSSGPQDGLITTGTNQLPSQIMVSTGGGGTARTQALYSQFDYDVGSLWSALDGLKFTAGYRYNWDWQSQFQHIRIVNIAALGAYPPTPICASGTAATNCDVFGSGHFHSPGWNLSLAYQVDPETLVYVESSKGYRPGGFTPGALLPGDQVYQPETLVNVEVGVKADWTVFGMKARTNLDAYHGFYSNIQEGVTATVEVCTRPGDPSSCTPSNFGVTENAAEATAEGIEFEGLLVPVDGLELHGSGSFNHNVFDSFTSATFGQLAGRSFTGFPKLKLDLGFTYHLPVDESWGDLSLSADWYYQTHYLTSTDNAPGAAPTHHLINTSIDWTDMFGQPIDGSFFMTNVTNATFVLGNFALWNNQGFVSKVYNEPREWGFRFKYRFGESSEPEAAPAAYVPPPVVAPAPAPKSYLVFFDFNKSDLTPQAKDIVDTAAKNAAANKVTQLTVTGHTDTVGSDAYNMRLSRRRAESVAAQLEKDGVPSSEIAIVAKGKRDLLVPTADGVREPQNRRVQIVFDGGASS
ncbi:MAG TPA: OmpA family protein [Alphaproteobacteria bacterium]|nr:OmpA family protein [Alphaproteobacteria bacterium]